jgi:endo-1,4-beta-D-glucanase Y
MPLLLLLACALISDKAAGPRSFPQNLAYPGARASLSMDPEEQDEQIRRYYERWVEDWYREEEVGGEVLGRVAMEEGERASTVSEGQGYGMVIFATMGDEEAQRRFDALWRYRLDHPSEIDERLMDWHVPWDGAAEGEDDDSAFDGDADIALGLLMAHEQWGSEGEIDYALEGRQVLAGLMDSAVGSSSRLPLLGDFVPTGDYDQWDIRSSDLMPASFAAFAAVDPAWTEVERASMEAGADLAEQLAPETGLLPDFAQDGADGSWDSAPSFLEGPTDDDWSYNAVRVPWRMGTAALLLDGAEARALGGAHSRWLEEESGGAPLLVQAGYRLDGRSLPDADYFNPLFVVTSGPAALARPDQQVWAEAIWESAADRHESYYADSITLQAMLLMSGDAWLPGVGP